MKFGDLMRFASMMFEVKEQDSNPTIRARLIWRHKVSGVVMSHSYANFGFCSGLKPELTVEMDSAMTPETELSYAVKNLIEAIEVADKRNGVGDRTVDENLALDQLKDLMARRGGVN